MIMRIIIIIIIMILLCLLQQQDQMGPLWPDCGQTVRPLSHYMIYSLYHTTQQQE